MPSFEDRTPLQHTPPRPSSAQARRRQLLNTLLREFEPRRSPTEITADDLRRWRDQALARGRSPSTANRHLAMLRSMLPRANLPGLSSRGDKRGA